MVAAKGRVDRFAPDAPVRPNTIGRLLDFAFGRLDDPDEPLRWPPDVFAVVAALLKRSGAYVDIVAALPRSARKAKTRARRLSSLGVAWRKSALRPRSPLPSPIRSWWRHLVSQRGISISSLRHEPRLLESLLGLLASSDEACKGVGVLTKRRLDAFDRRAIKLIAKWRASGSSLCRLIHPSVFSVLPKLHTPVSGLTLRSLSHNLAFWDCPEVRPFWNQLNVPRMSPKGLDVLVLPWPLKVSVARFKEGADFSEDAQSGEFVYHVSPACSGFAEKAVAIADEMKARGFPPDVVVLPELSVRPDAYFDLWDSLPDSLVIAGVGSRPRARVRGSNAAMVGIRNSETSLVTRQHKHHRWRLDKGQLGTYGLTSKFSPNLTSWWEQIGMEPRMCQFYCVKPWLTICVLICEDLARQDPVADLVRSVGPNLVIALLLDGPQANWRWSARYATVLADDPRCSVLTVTAAGMVDLYRSNTTHGTDRSVAIWGEPDAPAKPITLAVGSQGIVLRLKGEYKTEWSADQRSDQNGTGYIRVSEILQIGGGTKPTIVR